MKKRFLALPLLLLAASLAHAQSIQKYFGYYGGDVNNPPGVAIDEFKDHVNLYHILEWSGDTSDAGRAASANYVLAELAKAKAAHMQAIIPGYPFVLNNVSTNPNAYCWGNYSGASQTWASFAQQLISKGYLIPGNPDKSTVVAVYVVDEPDITCLTDQNGAAHPALQNAINAIRSGTPQLKTAVIFGNSYLQATQAMKLLDWVGNDDYGATDAVWNARLAELKSYAPGKKLIIVPGARPGCADVIQDDPTRFFNAMNSDPQIAWLAPFTWFSSQGCPGVRDMPSLRPAYTNFGATIKAQGCASSAAAGQFCRGTSATVPIQYLLGE